MYTLTYHPTWTCSTCFQGFLGSTGLEKITSWKSSDQVAGITSSSRMMIWLCWKRRQRPNKCRPVWTIGWTLAMDFAKHNAGPSRASFSCCQIVIIFAAWIPSPLLHDVYGSFTLSDGAPNRAYSMVLQSMQPVRVHACGLYCLIVIVGSRLASDRVSAAAHDVVVFALHQMLSSVRCKLSIIHRDAGLPFSSLTLSHSKCMDRMGQVRIERPGLGDVPCNPRTTQEALCAHMLLALVRHTLPKSCSGNVQMMFLLDARKALGLLLGLKHVFLGSKRKRK